MDGSNGSGGSSIIQVSKELDVLAQKVAGSALVPDAYRGKPQDVFVAMLMGHELGVSPTQAIQNIDVIDGRPHPRARLKVTLALKHPACEYFTCTSSTDKAATYATKRRGAPAEVKHTFTIEQAERAGLTRKPNWAKDPASMLRARASGQLADMVYPDATLGLPPDEYVEEAPGRVEAAPVTVEAPPPAPKPSPSRTEEVKALAAKALAAPAPAAPAVQDVELKAEPAPAPKPTPAKKRRELVVEVPATDWWAKCQALAKLRGLDGAALKAEVKGLGALRPTEVTEQVYEALERKFPAEPGANDGDVF